MMRILNGDILSERRGIIVHQVNCQRVMGAGLALQIRKKWPRHYEDYMSRFPHLGGLVITQVNSELYIIGVYGQDRYGKFSCYTDYSALEKGLKSVRKFADEECLPVYIPYGIGCGLAGGEWSKVQQILEATLPHAIVIRKAKDVSDAVEFWHKNETETSLREYLQMNAEEYQRFITEM